MLEVLTPSEFQKDLSIRLTQQRLENKNNDIGLASAVKELEKELYNASNDYPDHLDTLIIPEPTGSDYLKNILRAERDRVALFKEESEKFEVLAYEDLSKDGKHINRLKPLFDDQFPAHNYWFNTTEKGINLRPGALYKQNRIESISEEALTLGQDGVHGLVAGITGSGKSVFLNNLISNMMLEYPSWELDLYLLDFKKIEFSMYLSNKELQAPHVNVVGATEEMDYVLSIFRYLREALNDREKLFQALDGQDTGNGLANIKNLSDFRAFGRELLDKEVVLPRILLVIDEFQQLFINANREIQTEITRTIEVLTKKGRALGIHLLFSSQDLSGTLDSSTLSNFGIRFALPMDKNRSAMLIDSPMADSLEIGQVIAYNTREGDEEKRYQKFKVPFEDSKDGDSENSGLMNDLHIQSILEEESGFKKNKVYYQEDMMMNFNILEKVYAHCSDQIQSTLSSNNLSEYLLLGPGTVYNAVENDMIEFFMEKRDNEHISIISDRVEKNAYLLYLVLYNLRMQNKDRFINIYQDDKKILSTLDNLLDDNEILAKNRMKINDTLKFFDHLKKIFKVNNELKKIPDFEKQQISQDSVYEKIRNNVNVVIGLENMGIDQSSLNNLREYINISTEYNNTWIFVIEPTDSLAKDFVLSNNYQFLYVNNQKDFMLNKFEYTDRGLDSNRIEFKNKREHLQQGFKRMNLPELGEYKEPKIELPSFIFE